nr:hypothetical protein [Chroococcidiopsis sp. [FACHB-1243]]
MAVVVVEANCSEQRGGVIAVDDLDTEQSKRLQLIWVNQGYQGENFARVVEQLCGAKVEVVRRSESSCVILSKRTDCGAHIWLAQSESTFKQGL